MPLVNLTFGQTGTPAIRRESAFTKLELAPNTWFRQWRFALALIEILVKTFIEKHFLDGSE
jgi:hypothetical protein